MDLENRSIVDFPALTYLQKALELAPNDPYVNKLCGTFFAQMGGNEKAVPFLLKALQYGDQTALYSLAMLHLQQPETAMRYMEKYPYAIENSTEIPTSLWKFQLS